MDIALTVCPTLFCNKPIHAPKFHFTAWARESDKDPMLPVCGPCAHTCFGFDPASDERHPSIDVMPVDLGELKAPFFCQCHTLKLTGHKCCFEKGHKQLVVQALSSRAAHDGGGGVMDDEDISDAVEAKWLQEAKLFVEDVCYNADKASVVARGGSDEHSGRVQRLTEKLRRQIDLHDQYYDEEAQRAALRVIPLTLLMQRAKHAVDARTGEAGVNNNNSANTTSATNTDDQNGNNDRNNGIVPPPPLSEQVATQGVSHLQLELLRQLTAWFKNDFFKWVDKPACPRCDSNSSVVGVGQPPDFVPLPEEKQNWAERVEFYVCQRCLSEQSSASTSANEQQPTLIRFPRYNRAMRLLTWRRGRCGEWANCFCLCCIALGFETRFVLDTSDHVWVEVFISDFGDNDKTSSSSSSSAPNSNSNSTGRWVPVDCCENAVDSALMYESGWGKQNLGTGSKNCGGGVFAISNTQVVDVIRRYSVRPCALSVGRGISDTALSHLVCGLNYHQQLRCAPYARQLLEQRVMSENQELSQCGAVIKGTGEGTFKARQSGAGDWTRGRGEDGSSSSSMAASAAAASASAVGTQHYLMSNDALQAMLSSLSVAASDPNLFQFADEAQLFAQATEKGGRRNSNWIWKGGKENIVTVNGTSSGIGSNQKQTGFFFVQGCGCKLELIVDGEVNAASQDSSSGSGGATSSSSNCMMSQVAARSKQQLGGGGGGGKKDEPFLLKYPPAELQDHPRFPIPLHLLRNLSSVEQLVCNCCVLPCFSTTSANNKEQHHHQPQRRGIVGFTIGKTSLRVDLSFDASDPTLLKLVLSLRHINLPSLTDVTAARKDASASFPHFNSLQAVSVWDAKSKPFTGSGTIELDAAAPSSTESIRFVDVSGDSDRGNSSCSGKKQLSLLSHPLSLFVSVDRQGATTCMVFYRKSPASSPVCAAHVGSIVPLFCLERGAVPVSVHGLNAMVQSVQLSW